MLQVRRSGKPASRPRKRQMPARAKALKAALRGGLETLVASLADRAAEDTVTKWQRQEAGAALVSERDSGAAPGEPRGVSFEVLAELDFIPRGTGGRRTGAVRPGRRRQR